MGDLYKWSSVSWSAPHDVWANTRSVISQVRNKNTQIYRNILADVSNVITSSKTSLLKSDYVNTATVTDKLFQTNVVQ